MRHQSSAMRSMGLSSTRLIATSLTVLLLLAALLAGGQADDTSPTTTTSTPKPAASTAAPPATTAIANTTTTTTKPPSINVLDSALCKKCTCDKDAKLLDCSGKLGGEWLNADDWKTLQAGDIRFTVFRLEHNNLTQVPALPAYAEARSLFLGGNRIASIAIAAFQNWTSLETLDLSNNALDSKALVPDVFKGSYSVENLAPLVALKKLDLGYNLLHMLHSDLFEHLPALEELVLCKNTFQVINQNTVVAIAGIASLKLLDMSYMELKELPSNFLHGPRELETLILSGNLFTQLPEHLEYAVNLKRLVLDENPIADLEGDHIFPAMGNLEYLSFSYMPDIRNIGAYAFNKMPKLNTLVMSNNVRLTTIDSQAFARPTALADFADYPPLKELYMHNNNLTVFDHEWLVRWDKVTHLDLRFNPWVCDCDNSYLIFSVLPMVNVTAPLLTADLMCAGPKELMDVNMMALTTGQLDCYSGISPKSGGLVFVALLVGIVIGVPVTIGGMLLWRRGCFGLAGRAGRGGTSSAYSRASFSEEFHI